MIPVEYEGASSAFLTDLPEDMLLEKHFKLKELSNTSGDPELAQYVISDASRAFNNMLESFRLYYGQPIAPTSGYRQAEYNKKIGGATNSLHLYACACDFVDKYKKDRWWMISTWLRVLSEYESIGAVNLYDNGDGYYRYHVEAFSDSVLLYSASHVRIYNNSDDFEIANLLYKPLGYGVDYYGN